MKATASTHTDVFFTEEIPEPKVRGGADFVSVALDTRPNLTYLHFPIGTEEKCSELFADIAAEFVKLHEQMPELEGHHEAIHDNV
jgi:hypothetical protein